MGLLERHKLTVVVLFPLAVAKIELTFHTNDIATKVKAFLLVIKFPDVPVAGEHAGSQ